MVYYKPLILIKRKICWHQFDIPKVGWKVVRIWAGAKAEAKVAICC